MWRTAGSTGAVGLEVALAIAIGYFGGQWLDRKLGLAPWMMYIGLVAGIGAGIKALMRVTRQYRRSLAESDGAGGNDATSTKTDEQPPAPRARP